MQKLKRTMFALAWSKRIGLTLLIFSVLYLHVENYRLVKLVNSQHIIIAQNQQAIASFLEQLYDDMCKEVKI